MKKVYISLLLILVSYFVSAQGTAQLTLNITDYKQDTLFCSVIVNHITDKAIKFKFPKHSNVFKVSIPLENAAFVEISDGKNLLAGLIEPDDNLSVNYNFNNITNTLKLTGRGSGKFNLLQENFQTSSFLNIERKQALRGGVKYYEGYFHKIDSLETGLLKKLDKIMFGISSSSYNYLKGEIKGMTLLNRYLGVEELLEASIPRVNAKSSISDKTKTTLTALDQFNDNYYLSPSYLNAVYHIMMKEFNPDNAPKHITIALVEKYNFLESKVPGQLRMPLQIMLLDEEMEKNVDQDEVHNLIKRTFKNNATSEYKPFIENVFAQFRIGKNAPAFVIEDVNGNKVSLNNYKGKVVYLNFWFSGHTGCQTLFSKLKVVAENFKDNPDIVFLSVSLDSKELAKRAVKFYGLTGINTFTEGKGMEHPVIKAYKVERFPTSFVIDRKGNFYSTLPSENPLELIGLINSALSEPIVMGKAVTKNRADKN